jgi:hypothetical protein
LRLQVFRLPYPCAAGFRHQGLEGRARHALGVIGEIEHQNPYPVSAADLAQIFQSALSIAGERWAIQNGNHHTGAGMRSHGLRGGVQREQERRRIGLARRHRRVQKCLFDFLAVLGRIDVLRVGTAAAPQFDFGARGLHPVPCHASGRARARPRCFGRTGTEYKCK